MCIHSLIYFLGLLFFVACPGPTERQLPTENVLVEEALACEETFVGNAEESRLSNTFYSKSAIRGGKEKKYRGVVEITFQKALNEYVIQYNKCTGSMIHSRAILTSAHCLEHLFPNNDRGFIRTFITYFDPEKEQRVIVGRVSNLGADTSFYSREGIIHPYYRETKDVNNDLGLIISDEDWHQTDTSDYLGLYYDIMADARYNVIWGSGYGLSNGTGEGILRYEPVYISGYDEYYLYDHMDEYSTCGGDSGGPWIRDDESGIAITGVHSGSDHSIFEKSVCGVEGRVARATRVSSKVDWIEGVLRQEGLLNECVIKRLPGQCTRQYKECF